MSLAIFDLDHTILEGDSDSTWLRFLADNKLVDKQETLRRNTKFYQDYVAGQLNFNEYANFAFAILRKFPFAYLKSLRRAYFKQEILPMIRPKALSFIKDHRERGHTVLVSTATNEFVAYPAAMYVKADGMLATRLERSDEGFTGKYHGVPNFRKGKVTNLLAWMKENNEHQLATTYFYTDSINDLPLLRIVGYPRVVNGDPALQEVAEKRGWQIIDFTN